MSGLFGSVKKAKPPPIVEPVTDDTEAVKAAAFREAEMLRKKRGFRSTIATSGQGVTGNAPGARNTLG